MGFLGMNLVFTRGQHPLIRGKWKFNSMGKIAIFRGERHVPFSRKRDRDWLPAGSSDPALEKIPLFRRGFLR